MCLDKNVCGRSLHGRNFFGQICHWMKMSLNELSVDEVSVDEIVSGRTFPGRSFRGRKCLWTKMSLDEFFVDEVSGDENVSGRKCLDEVSVGVISLDDFSAPLYDVNAWMMTQFILHRNVLSLQFFSCELESCLINRFAHLSVCVSDCPSVRPSVRHIWFPRSM